MPKKKKKSLGRTLGLMPTVAIGVGTMVGAGIFIFPGIAAGKAGPAALLSFVIGGIVALIIALCTSELVTAMPKNGGAYYFISRSLGTFAGSIIGISQWMGLLFAAAFYLTGFGEYAIEISSNFGVALDTPVSLIALGSALLLTSLNLFGTKGVGKVQNTIVLVLTGILSLLFFYGLLKQMGWDGHQGGLSSFTPNGWTPVFTTAAMIFTSYLGFVQIATVAGEVKNPRKNLPRALIGSVLVVIVIYVLAVVVSSAVFSHQELARLGEIAMVEVAKKLAGDYGGYAILFAGLLATLSSANASILSSSRTVFALGKDKVMPGSTSNVNQKFKTPHWAIALAGLPIAAITLYDRIEILAEVASFLHLIIYGGICISLIQFKRRKPLWYAPTFKIKGGYVLPIIGAMSCLGLIALMNSTSILVGSSLVIVILLWYFAYVKRNSSKHLSTPEPPHISPSLRAPEIVYPIKKDQNTHEFPENLLKSFRSTKLVILGYHIVKDQVSPEQAEEKIDSEVNNQLKKISWQAEQQGIQSEIETIYCEKYREGLNQYLDENEMRIILTPSQYSSILRVVVPIYSKHQISKALTTILKEITSNGIDATIIIYEEEEQHLTSAVNHQISVAGIEKKIQLKNSNTSLSTEDITQELNENDIVMIVEEPQNQKNDQSEYLFYTLQEKIQQPLLLLINKQKSNRNE